MTQTTQDAILLIAASALLLGVGCALVELAMWLTRLSTRRKGRALAKDSTP